MSGGRRRVAVAVGVLVGFGVPVMTAGAAPAIAPVSTVSPLSSSAPAGSLAAAAEAQASAHPVAATRLGGGALHAASGVGGTPYVALFADRAALDRALALGGIRPTSVWTSGLFGFAAPLQEAQVATLRAMPGLRAVEADHRVSVTAAQTNPPWGLDRIDQRSLPLDARYTPAGTGLGVTAYVIDSGIWFTHTEFTARIVNAAYVDFGDGTGPWDCDGHGTHVSGTLGGTTYGIAKNVSLVPVKVLDCTGSGSMADLVAGIDWVITQHPPGQPAVANISSGGPLDAVVNQAVRDLVSDGVTVVVAAGNDGGNSCNLSPASEPLAITVGAVDQADHVASFSDTGSCDDLFAPGVDILSAFPLDASGKVSDSGSIVASGTSMASPHVAGAAAIVLQQNPAASPAVVWSTLQSTATTGVVLPCCGSPDRLLYLAPAPDTPFVGLTPQRLLDTRPGATTVDGTGAGAGLRPANSVTEVVVAGRAGVPGDAAAVALNVTVTGARAAGYVTAFPCQQGQPTASNLNFDTGQTVPNLVVSKVGAGGKVCLYTSAPTQLIADESGYYPAASSFTGVAPARLLDTRPGSPTVDGIGGGAGIRPASSVTEVVVAGRAGLPANPSAVVLNVTATGTQGQGYVTVFPCGETQPTASNLNFVAGQTVPNLVVAKVGATGSVCLFTAAPTQLIADISGFYPAGSSFTPLTPARLLDTRPGAPTVDGVGGGAGVRPAGSLTEVVVAGRGGVPANARAVVLNVTVAEPQASGYLTAFPCGDAPPNASNLNFVAGQTVPNLVVSKLGAGGSVCLYTTAPIQLIADVSGFDG